jgi:HEPN domain-containing protein
VYNLGEYVSAQDRWISDGLHRIYSIPQKRKTLARSFFDSAKIDLAAYKRLKEDLHSQAIFHLQQAAEKVAKAMLILDMNDLKYSDLKYHNFIYALERLIRKHDENLVNLSNIENAMFRQALTFASPKFLDFLKPDNSENRNIYSKQIENDIKLRNEIVRLNKELGIDIGGNKSRLKVSIEQKEREFLDSGLLTGMLKGRSKNKILFANDKEIKSLILRNEDELPLCVFSAKSRKALFSFFNILFITVITYPHEAYTRYPNHDGSIKDYTDIGIFKASDTVYGRLCGIISPLEELNLL